MYVDGLALMTILTLASIQLASLVTDRNLWHKRDVPIFIERYVLPALATITIALLLLNPMKFDWTQRITGVLAVFFFAYFLAYTLHLYNNAAKQGHADPAEPTRSVFDRPFIFPSLVIDSVRRGKVTYHLQIVNGRLPVKDIRVASKTANMSQEEYTPDIPRTLPPDGRLSIRGLPVGIFSPGKPTSLIVRVAYKAEAGNTEQDYVHTSKFFIEADPNPRVVDPESSNYEQGSVQGPSPVAAIIEQFALKQVTAFLVIPEKMPDGKPNVVLAANEQREFVFDPVARLVGFQMKTQDGRPVRLVQSFSEQPTGRHIVMLVWDDSSGALLGVDGVEVRDGLVEDPKIPNKKEKSK